MLAVVILAGCSGGDFVRTEKRDSRIANRESGEYQMAVVGGHPGDVVAFVAAVEAAAAAEAERVRGIEEARINEIWARWTAVGRCEQPGNGIGGVEWTVVSSTYSGGLGISNGAWVQWGGLAYAPNAGLADPWSQMLVAEAIMATAGRRAWGCPVP